ncbi:hypothetical protein RHSIM_Rhsim07G0128100 [Rhododendron simsii]|uniref:Uncharacterized protein n=1 Tax=Rhododendron simsii TaxID=118357 RepID=A0A834GRM5_RHOSS|nr:hypothetical protein RHSIM_Rhsim07G0128100 [Rhododendron simsii]
MTTEWGCYVSEKEYQKIEQKLKEAELKRVPLTASPLGSKMLPPCKVPPIRLLLPTTQPIREVPKRKSTEPFAAKLKTREQVAFAKRHNIQQRLTTKAISDMLKKLVQENKTNIEDVQDVARLICMFLIVKLFFPTSGIMVSWKHVDAMEDLTKMKSYNWVVEIHNEFVESIKTSQHSPKDVKGCQLLLPDSGSTLVPNTYLPTNARVFPHLMLSPLPAYIHPDQDEPKPNLEFLCSSAVQRVTEPLVEQLQEVNSQQEVIIDTLKEQNKTNEVKIAELLQKIDFLYKEGRNQQGKDKEALLLAIQNIKESHMAISEEKMQMELEFKEAVAK